MVKAIVTSDVPENEARQRLAALAWLLDSSIPIPGLKATIGLDGLLSLIPVVGDSLGALLSSYIVAEAARLGVPKTVLLRMSLNVAIDALIGMIPLLGDLFDFAWKANRRNVDLLQRYLDHPHETRRNSLFSVIVVFAVLFLVIFGLLAASFWLIGALWSAIVGA